MNSRIVLGFVENILIDGIFSNFIVIRQENVESWRIYVGCFNYNYVDGK